MMNRQVITKEDNRLFNVGEDVYEGVGFSATSGDNDFTSDDQKMLEAIQRKLGGMSTVNRDTMEDTDSADLKPTESTLSMSFKRNYEQSDVAVVAKSKLNTKTKIAIASYTAVVLILILAIALCSVAVGNSFGIVSATQSTYVQTNTQLSDLQNQLTADNYDELYNSALNMGFVEAGNGNSYQYNKLETRPAQNFNVQTNWFDQLCEWVSSVFGG
ncbi:MAG: hypothetical protein NC350_01980 [Corallococcus sp.]|nr:hypothetical protein [Corallococcus sp.]